MSQRMAAVGGGGLWQAAEGCREVITCAAASREPADHEPSSAGATGGAGCGRSGSLARRGGGSSAAEARETAEAEAEASTEGAPGSGGTVGGARFRRAEVFRPLGPSAAPSASRGVPSREAEALRGVPSASGSSLRDDLYLCTRERGGAQW